MGDGSDLPDRRVDGRQKADQRDKPQRQVWESQEEGAVNRLLAVALCSGHRLRLLAVSIEDPETFSE